MTDCTEELGLLEDEEIELDHAALELSALDHEGIDLDPYYDLLAEMGARLGEVGEPASDVIEQAAALKRVFGVEYGFVGDVDTYDAPVNADLVRVLDRRQGLPVSLSILYVAAARRMGWTCNALNTPGHLLVRLGADRFMLLDPFAGGDPVSEDGLAALLRTYVGPDAQVLPEYLAPIPNRAVLVRLLGNQAARAEQASDPERAVTLRGRIARIAPEYPDVWWELARLQVSLHDNDGARDSLSAMLEVTREPERRRQVTEALEALSSLRGNPG